MMKTWFSLLCGLIIAFTLSYFFLGYNGWTIHQTGKNGEITKTINELDFNLITNAFLIMMAASILIYGVWTLIEKKRA